MTVKIKCIRYFIIILLSGPGARIANAASTESSLKQVFTANTATAGKISKPKRAKKARKPKIDT